MIRALTLTNWRNYEDVRIELGAGTTFVVASNGVGKSSLTEAARFALFGTFAADSGSPIRVGASIAAAAVELVLPNGLIVTIERSLTEARGKLSASVRIHLDGTPVGDEALAGVFRDAYNAEPAFLARLTMPSTSRQVDVPTSLGLETHLGRYFGVEGLHRAIEALTVQLKTTEKQIKEIKGGNASNARQLAELEAAVTASAATIEDSRSRHEAAQAKYDLLRETLQGMQAHATWTARRDQRLLLAGEVLDLVRLELGEEVAQPDVEHRLRRTIAEADSAIENARIRIAVHRSRAELIRANQARLDESEDDCPVCRRPLDEATIHLAHRSNDAEVEVIEAEVEDFRREETSAVERRDHARELLRRWNDLPDPGPEPVVAADQRVSVEDLEPATQLVSVALDQLVDARARHVSAEQRLQDARQADAAMRTLENLFRTEAHIRVALAATQETLKELLEQTVGPIASEVNQRWADLFPGRGPLSTRADATMTRTVNGHPLPFQAFSTGESIGATIVLRLLVTQMATTADFCWFDEPLEHLDPNVRRQVANILAGATADDSRLRQVVVTTYEEPLARQLLARTPEDVHLVDVRSAPADRHASNTVSL